MGYSEEKQKTAFKGNQHTSESSADRTCTVSRNLDS